MALSIRRLSAGIGAEIGGVDLTKPLDNATFAEIERAWQEHLILLFRSQKLTHQQHIAFSRRFGEFQKKLGLAKNILTVRLRALVDQGILKTAPASDGSAYQEYLLTPKGRGVFPILVALRQWSEEFDERPEEIATILVDREKGKPVRKLELHSQDGRLLSAGDIALKPRTAAKARKRITA